MKRSFSFIFLLSASLWLLSFKENVSEDNDKIFDERCYNYIRLQHDSLGNELSNLLGHLKAQQFDAAKEALKNCRLRFKRTEAFVAYYFPGDAIFLNGANEKEIEDDDEPNFVIDPHGFQVMEDLLYSENPAQHFTQLVNEADSISGQLKLTTAAMETMTISPRAFFEAFQMHLIRLFMLTAINVETPHSKNAIAELKASFGAMSDCIHLVYPPPYEERSMVLKVFCDKLKSTSDYLDACKSVERVAYLNLYRDHYIPLSDQLRTARGNLVEGNFFNVTAIDLNATSVFDEAAFNTFFFNPTQKKTGSPERAELGKKLFFDPVLSANNERACASCHRPEKAFSDGLPKSMSMDGKTPISRNAPTLINAAIQGRLFHDARTMNLERQADEVLGNPLEMHHDFSSSVQKLKRSPEYVSIFKSAFAGTADTFISAQAVLLAIAEYERTLVSFNSKFDKTIRGEEDVLTPDEMQGFQLFITKGECAGCHFLPLFSGTVPPEYKKSDWEVLGTPKANDRTKPEIDPDAGRAGVHRTTLYRHAFKTPGLRNVELTAPYMHNGVFNTLDEVMDFYNVGGGIGWGIDVPNQTLSSDSLRLSDTEKQQIIAFLKSLTDTAGLTSKPESLPSFPKDPELNARAIGGKY